MAKTVTAAEAINAVNATVEHRLNIALMYIACKPHLKANAGKSLNDFITKVMASDATMVLLQTLISKSEECRWSQETTLSVVAQYIDNLDNGGCDLGTYMADMLNPEVTEDSPSPPTPLTPPTVVETTPVDGGNPHNIKDGDAVFYKTEKSSFSGTVSDVQGNRATFTAKNGDTFNKVGLWHMSLQPETPVEAEVQQLDFSAEVELDVVKYDAAVTALSLNQPIAGKQQPTADGLCEVEFGDIAFMASLVHDASGTWIDFYLLDGNDETLVEGPPNHRELGNPLVLTYDDKTYGVTLTRTSA